MSLPIYIAGGSSEIDLCQQMISAVSAAGGHITFNWTTVGSWSLGRPLTMSERANLAAFDLAAVAKARLFWLLLPERLSEGAATELGAALTLRDLGRHIEVVVSGPMLDSRLFPARADYAFADHDRALAHVLDAVRAVPSKR